MPAGASTEPSASTVVLGRPTDDSITLSVLAVDDAQMVVAYGAGGGAPTNETPSIELVAGKPREVVLEGLAAGTRYAYRLLDAGTRTALVDGTFTTARSPGEPFVFTVTADPHLDGNTDPVLWQQTLSNVASDAPDFHIDLGDTFMTDKYRGDRSAAARQYLAQRGYFGAIAGSVPLYLVLGNHDGESGKSRREGADSEAMWSNTMRTTYFPNPLPNGFYTGDSAMNPEAGLLQDYYAWEWGDALFVVLNPYSNSTGPKDDGWGLTLGDAQYAWLRATLEASDATHKFVFIHQLAGGLGQPGRGGADAAQFGEWGGKNQDGSDGFAVHRPGWDVPIHDLLVDNGVTAVFHGHDHLYAREELDGIAYLEVPQPAQARSGGTGQAAEYGYTRGTILGSSGHLRVTVGSDAVTSDYVRSVLPADQADELENRQVAHSSSLSNR
jgi:hypothetical protein